MYLTQTAEYALRAMALVAAAGEARAMRAQDLADVTAIPLPYLSKILRRLVVAGLLKSQKGHGGGFVLARPAARIRFEEVLAAADYQPDPEACAFGWRNCDPGHPCPLHPAWAQLKNSYATWAASMTLADVLQVDIGKSPRSARRARRLTGARRARSASARPRRSSQGTRP